MAIYYRNDWQEKIFQAHARFRGNVKINNPDNGSAVEQLRPSLEHLLIQRPRLFLDLCRRGTHVVNTRGRGWFQKHPGTIRTQAVYPDGDRAASTDTQEPCRFQAEAERLCCVWPSAGWLAD